MIEELDVTGLVTYLLSRAVVHRAMAGQAMQVSDFQRVISCAAFVTEDVSLVAFLLGTDELEDLIAIASALEPEKKIIEVPGRMEN